MAVRAVRVWPPASQATLPVCLLCCPQMPSPHPSSTGVSEAGSPGQLPHSSPLCRGSSLCSCVSISGRLVPGQASIQISERICPEGSPVPRGHFSPAPALRNSSCCHALWRRCFPKIPSESKRPPSSVQGLPRQTVPTFASRLVVQGPPQASTVTCGCVCELGRPTIIFRATSEGPTGCGSLRGRRRQVLAQWPLQVGLGLLTLHVSTKSCLLTEVKSNRLKR